MTHDIDWRLIQFHLYSSLRVFLLIFFYSWAAFNRPRIGRNALTPFTLALCSMSSQFTTIEWLYSKLKQFFGIFQFHSKCFFVEIWTIFMLFGSMTCVSHKYCFFVSIFVLNSHLQSSGAWIPKFHMLQRNISTKTGIFTAFFGDEQHKCLNMYKLHGVDMKSVAMFTILLIFNSFVYTLRLFTTIRWKYGIL